MKVLHSSDLHGRYKKLLCFEEPFDLWVDTGDFFPNKGRRPATGYRIVPWLERSYQSKWWRWKSLGSRLARWLDGRPMISVSGNHDFVSLAVLLQAAGAHAHAVQTERAVDVAGLRWAGFRDIPYMDGEWPGEAHTFGEAVDGALAQRPDILLTHAPPAGVLDDGEGIPELATALRAHPGPRAHLFGHVHHHGGQETTLGSVRCVNGAEGVRVITL